MKLCSVEGCNRKHEAKGYCDKHYKQFKKHGRIIDDELKPKNCLVEGCNEKHYGKGYCLKHYTQVRKYGTTLERTIYDSNDIVIHKNHAEIIIYDKYGKEEI